MPASLPLRALRDRRWADASVLAAWAALTLFGACHHEPFRDEAQKWLIARDAASLPELFRFLPLERAPALWYLLLLPFAKAGAPFWTAAALNWALAFGAGLVLWFAAPLPRPVKALFLFSYFMVYDVPAIARNYSLFALLAFTALALHPSRRTHPYRFCLTLVALANTNYAGAGIAAALGAIFLVEAVRCGLPWRRTAPQALLLGLGVAAALAQMFGAGAPVLEEVGRPPSLEGFLYLLGLGFPWLKPAHLAALLVLWGLFLLSLLLRPRALVLAIAGVAPPAFVLWKGIIARQNVTCLLVGTLLAAGLAAQEGESPWRREALRRAARRLDRLRTAAVWLMAIPFGVSVSFGLTALATEYRMRYSDAEAAVAAIREAGLDRLAMTVFPDYIGTTLLPYFPGKRIFYTGANRWGTGIQQDLAHFAGGETPLPEGVRRAFSAAAREPAFLLILQQPAHLLPFCELRYGTDPSQVIWQEAYYIYECRSTPWTAGAPAPR